MNAIPIFCCNTFAEGASVRSTNPLYASYGVGRVQKVRNGIVKVEFNPSVFMQPPYRSPCQHAIQ